VEILNGPEQEIFMGEHGAFEIAGGAGSEHDQQVVCERYGPGDRRFCRGARVGRIVEARGRRGCITRMLQIEFNLAAVMADLFDDRRKTGGIHQYARPTVGDDAHQFRHRQLVVDRHHDSAGLGAGKKDLQKGAAIDHHRGHAVDFFNTFRQ
jgi:hypothetical protein